MDQVRSHNVMLRLRCASQTSPVAEFGVPTTQQTAERVVFFFFSAVVQLRLPSAHINAMQNSED